MSNLGDVFRGFRISSSGLSAERTRINVIASNIANAHTTRMPGSEGPTPYQRQVVHFEPILERHAGRVTPMGVRVTHVGHDNHTPFEEINDPSHPDAVDGVVRYPNVNATKEMADLITAMRAYEANLKAQESFVRMAERALRIAR
jgi:flagellar basal-body rod protein FlgC